MASNREWPRGQENGAGRNAPVANYLTRDGFLNSARSLAGPLRMGTAPGVGPKGNGNGGNSDFGVDRITPRDFDPMGTSRERSGTIPSERLKR